MPDLARLTGRLRKLELPAEPLRARPRNMDQIADVLQNRKRFPSPVRPQGANSSATRCAKVHGGTALDMSALNRILHLDRRTVTVEAGIRLRDLVRILADRNLELLATDDQLDRSVGGIVSSGSLFSSTAMDEPNLAASVCAIRLVTPRGRALNFNTEKPEMLQLLRQSYGLMGIVYSVTLRVRKQTLYTVRHGKMGFAELAKLVPQLANAKAGVKIYLLPFRNRAFIELRDASMAARPPRTAIWKLGDWLTNKLLPDLVHLLRRVPGRRLRDPLIDGFSEATQALVNTRLVDAGSNAMEQTGKFRRVGADARIQQSTWAFPARDFGAALYSYREYCQRHYKTQGFRCNLPAVVHRLRQDQHALLSPSFDGPAFALSIRTTVTAGWDDFLIDFAAIAAHFGGIPILNQTRGFTPAQATRAYGERLVKFKALRQQMDPQDRLLNQFLAEHIG
ncbi:MAG: FAD-binding protein [Chromatiales bacterium]|nr:MAG: FAD-binding protein [Chromatiales bacterium]